MTKAIQIICGSSRTKFIEEKMYSIDQTNFWMKGVAWDTNSLSSRATTRIKLNRNFLYQFVIAFISFTKPA